MAEKIIKISTDYTENPGGREKKEGPFSGEDFRKKFLEPFFNSRKKDETLIIDLDGLNGYPSSFFEEAFGGIARLFSSETVLQSIRFVCNDNPMVIDDMISYINQEYAKK